MAAPRRAALALSLAALACACIPPTEPWLIDRPIAWGIRASVVQPGGYSSGLVVPAGQARATALPLDTLELEWAGAGPPGTTFAPPIWLALSSDNLGDLVRAGPLEPCPDLVPLALDRPCLLGQGERLRFALGGAFTNGDSQFLRIRVLALASAGDPATCLERLQTDPPPDLTDCELMTRALALGPLPSLLDAIAEYLPPEIELPEIPPEVADDEPDTHPRILGFDIARESPAGRVALFAADGDTVPVRAGERVIVAVRFDEFAAQKYDRVVRTDPPTNRIDTMTESLRVRIGLTTLVDGYTPIGAGHAHRWIAPDSREPVDVFFHVTDSREGRAFARLRFVTEDAS